MRDVLLAEVTLKIKKPWHINQQWTSVEFGGCLFPVFSRCSFTRRGRHGRRFLHRGTAEAPVCPHSRCALLNVNAIAVLKCTVVLCQHLVTAATYVKGGIAVYGALILTRRPLFSPNQSELSGYHTHTHTQISLPLSLSIQPSGFLGN